MKKKKTKVMFNNYLQDPYIKRDDKVIEYAKELIYLEQKIGVCIAHGK